MAHRHKGSGDSDHVISGGLVNNVGVFDPESLDRTNFRGFKRRGTIAEKIAEGSLQPDFKYISALRGQKKSCDKSSFRYKLISMALELCDGTLKRDEREPLLRSYSLR